MLIQNGWSGVDLKCVLQMLIQNGWSGVDLFNACSRCWSKMADLEWTFLMRAPDVDRDPAACCLSLSRSGAWCLAGDTWSYWWGCSLCTRVPSTTSASAEDSVPSPLGGTSNPWPSITTGRVYLTTHAYVNAHTFTYTHTYRRTHVHTHTHTHTCVHTHTHIQAN